MADLLSRPISLLDLSPSEIRPLTSEESWLLTTLLLSDKGKEVVGLDHEVFEQDGVAGMSRSAVVARLHAAGIKISLASLLAILGWSSRPGDLVLYAYACLELARKRSLDLVSIDQLTLYAFPNGIPTNEGFDRAWAAQKYFNGAADNWLDTQEAWAALPYKEDPKDV